MPRKQHKYHYIYKTTCTINGKFYIGMHSTDNLDDGYMGSGKRLKRSLNKHGIENHTKEILEFLDDRDSLTKRELEIVNEQCLLDPLCMNLQLGGGGGFKNEEHKLKFQSSGVNASKVKMHELRKDPDWMKKYTKAISEGVKLAVKENRLNSKTFLGKKHSEETKMKMSDKAKQRIGSKNSQFGTIWITNGKENKKIKKDEKIPEGWSKGRKLI